ncbi:MAG TPA: ATPase, partial [Bacteroidetes bacterium]|nr:ATPase [Bacteroidota bacterium]
MVIGTLLLLLPNSTNIELSVIDALFTSTSAVCVTGLIVVDTATAFTPMGQTIILVLIQAGGIGILTFTSFFGMYLRTSSSFQSQLMLGDMLNEDRMSDIFKNLVRVIVFTISIELIFAGF